MPLRLPELSLFAFTAAVAVAAPAFTKIKIDSFFYTEGAAIADFTGDGVMDVAAGPRIFAGPDFKKSTVYRSPHAFD